MEGEGRRHASLADQLAEQDVTFAELQCQLDEARKEGERLRSAAVDEPPPPPWDDDDDGPSVEALLAAADATSAASAGATSVSAVDDDDDKNDPVDSAPSMADLMTLAARGDGDGGHTTRDAKPCSSCGEDPYAQRAQLIHCAACFAVFHTGCVALRTIPFTKPTKTDWRHRDLFIKRYFGEWRCAACRRDSEPAAAAMATTGLGDPPLAPAPGGCATCGENPPTERAQLVACSSCAAKHHTSCQRLRRIPFSDAPCDAAGRERFSRIYFATWRCLRCATASQDGPSTNEALAADLAKAKETIESLNQRIASLQVELAARPVACAECARRRSSTEGAPPSSSPPQS